MTIILPGSDGIIKPTDVDQKVWSDEWPSGHYEVAERPFDHINANLYLGGAGAEINNFRYVICCTPDVTYRGTSKTIVHLATFHDTPHALPPDWLLSDAIDIAFACMKKGPTLVHCTAGINRSALVVALVLVDKLGWDPIAAIHHLRKSRSDFVLSNKLFEKRILDAAKYKSRPKI